MVIHLTNEQLLTPTLPLQTRNQAERLLRPKMKDKMTMFVPPGNTTTRQGKKKKIFNYQRICSVLCKQGLLIC